MYWIGVWVASAILAASRWPGGPTPGEPSSRPPGLVLPQASSSAAVLAGLSMGTTRSVGREAAPDQGMPNHSSLTADDVGALECFLAAGRTASSTPFPGHAIVEARSAVVQVNAVAPAASRRRRNR